MHRSRTLLLHLVIVVTAAYYEVQQYISTAESLPGIPIFQILVYRGIIENCQFSIFGGLEFSLEEFGEREWDECNMELYSSLAFGYCCMGYSMSTAGVIYHCHNLFGLIAVTHAYMGRCVKCT